MAAVTTTGSFSIESLPPEMLELVFSYLDVKGIQCAASVCSNWRRTAYQRSLWRNRKPVLFSYNSEPAVLDSLVERGIRRVVLYEHSNVERVVSGLSILDGVELTCHGELADDSDVLLRVFSNPIRHLTVLKLLWCFCDLTDELVDLVSRNVPNLVHLDLESSVLSRAAVRSIVAGLRQLRYLQLRNASLICDEAVRDLADSKLQLEYLAIMRSEYMTDQAVLHLSIGMPGLRSLDLTGCSVTDASLVHLARLPNLRQFRMADYCEFTDAGMIPLSTMTTLLDLHLGYSNIGDVGLAHLVIGKSRIVWLNLAECVNVTDVGLEHLAQLTELREVNLTDCFYVTEASLTILRQKKGLTVVLTSDVILDYYYDIAALARLAAYP